MRPKIKICGITREEEIRMLNDAGVDYAGFVFYEKSKRYIRMEDAVQLKKQLDSRIKSVAVTVSPDAELVRAICANDFDIIQIHKDIDEEALRAATKPVWMAINVSDAAAANDKLRQIEQMAELSGKEPEGFVVDAENFGSGRTFDWHAGNIPKMHGLFILAGGLDAENAGEAIRLFSPDVVDVSSSVEGNSGKDEAKIKEFINSVRKAADNE